MSALTPEQREELAVWDDGTYTCPRDGEQHSARCVPEHEDLYDVVARMLTEARRDALAPIEALLANPVVRAVEGNGGESFVAVSELRAALDEAEGGCDDPGCDDCATEWDDRTGSVSDESGPDSDSEGRSGPRTPEQPSGGSL